MSKYEPLQEKLVNSQKAVERLSFDQIEKLLGFDLPVSARRHSAWWGNHQKGHSQSRAWMDIGWRVRRIDKIGQEVEFVRETNGFIGPEGALSNDDLYEQAGRLTGIEDRHLLERRALRALLDRVIADDLIALGGTMPNFEFPRRERP